MAKGRKYWEVEVPQELTTEKNVVKVYPENGKIQVFPRVTNTAYGIGKGATVDLETMSEEEVKQFVELVNQAVAARLAELVK